MYDKSFTNTHNSSTDIIASVPLLLALPLIVIALLTFFLRPRKCKLEITPPMVLPSPVVKIPPTGFHKIPSEIFGTIRSYTSLSDITCIINVLSTNRELFSRRDCVMSSVVKSIENKEDSFRSFSKLVVSGNTIGVRWFDASFLNKALDYNGARIGAALNVAAWRGNIALMEELLTMGALIEVKGEHGYTALHWAASGGQKEVVETLLENGANLEAGDDGCKTALHKAARWGRKEVVECLLNHGADLEAKSSNNRTAIHEAASYGHMQVVESLVECGANLEAKNHNGCTALRLAAACGQKEVVEMLLDCGADSEVLDNSGRTALECAVIERHNEIALLLRNCGTKETTSK